MKKYKVVTLGCRTNQYESQGYIDQLKSVGYSEALTGERADLCIVNSCTVTEQADKKSLYQLRKLKREHPDARLVVTGCMVSKGGRDLPKVPEGVLVVPNKQKESLLSDLYPEEDFPEFSIKRFDAHTRAFVKVQDGCNSYCSYCIIPFVRGRSRSRTKEDILKEVHELVKNGYKEVVITGINVGDFDGGSEGACTLAQLVREIDQVEGLERLRISSIDPDEVDDDLLDAVVNGKKTCPSMHIVLQAGSNVVLKRMNRKYTIADFFHTVDRLKKARPDFTFTTDVIVGFPGERDEDFQETMDLVERTQFAKVHVFPYSVRPKTRAERFTDHVAKPVIMDRRDRLLRHTEKVSSKLRDQYIGVECDVLIETEDPLNEGRMIGHTPHFLQVSVPSHGLKSNDIVRVRCVSNEPSGLMGEIV